MIFVRAVYAFSPLHLSMHLIDDRIGKLLFMKMTSDRCLIVIAGDIKDHTFNRMCYIAESLSTLLPNFQYRNISKCNEKWDYWLKETCKHYGWTHNKSPLVWKEIGITRTRIDYVGGAYQFWKLLKNYYDVTSYLSEEDLEDLHEDLLHVNLLNLIFRCPFVRSFVRSTQQFRFTKAYKVKKMKARASQVQEKYNRITIIGAGRSMCLDLVPQLLMTKELWSSHGIIINLYDEPGCYFKLRRILRDSGTIGAGIRRVFIVDSIPEGLENCDVLIYLDSYSREDNEGNDAWFERNYKIIENVCNHVNECAPSHMKVIFCSMSLPCFYAGIMHELVTKLPKTNVIVASNHHGLEIIYELVHSMGFTLRQFGCPPVWGFLGINHFVDVSHMVQKCYVYRPNKRALRANEKVVLPLGTQHTELRWFFYMVHDKNPYVNYFRRKALLRYQVGRSEDFPKCKAICDLLRLWFSKTVGDEIISLGIASDGSFGIPEGIVFSQPVCLNELEDGSRVWVPFVDFPMPNMEKFLFQSFVDMAIYMRDKITEIKNKSNSTRE
ncbi:putative malate dehydrogenase 1B [Ceratina calcarata]|uniref:Malate dehydrogenase 1B n=1 Tax=Ceratina calcarata TaxID=156304 RepID=A0AAJ7WDU9_9HYME|nr:putative malate dehydrogenase 1B [Ceratina calcarata]